MHSAIADPSQTRWEDMELFSDITGNCKWALDGHELWLARMCMKFVANFIKYSYNLTLISFNFVFHSPLQPQFKNQRSRGPCLLMSFCPHDYFLLQRGHFCNETTWKLHKTQKHSDWRQMRVMLMLFTIIYCYCNIITIIVNSFVLNCSFSVSTIPFWSLSFQIQTQPSSRTPIKLLHSCAKKTTTVSEHKPLWSRENIVWSKIVFPL